VYRGAAYPALTGTYFFTDYCSGTLWALAHDPSGGWQRVEVLPSPSSFAGYSSFGEDEAGELYVTALGSGTVYQIVATSIG
jgi:hypothetical protein